jgi:Flp pilus assembly protein TadD
VHRLEGHRLVVAIVESAMSPRARVVVVAAVGAAALAGLAVGVTLATRTDVPKTTPRRPPLADDPTASRVLRGEIRDALDAWPAGTVRRLRILAEQHPRSGLVRLELGVALAFGGQSADAETAWRDAERVQPDSPSAVRAEDLRHPRTPPGRPPFIPSFSRPRTPVQAHLARGVVFQAALRPVSAEREFAAAVRLAPNDPEARVAAAVARYDKDAPARAFSRLGPLVRRFPHAQTVRFHLGLLLIYLGDLPKAREQLLLARAEGPGTRLGKRARALLRAGGRTP